jgi:hypothetical protein
VILRRRGVATRLAPPVSVVLASNAKRYIAGLTDFREGRTDDWIGGFANAVALAAQSTDRLRTQIDAFLEQLVERAGSPRADSVARKITLGLPQQPIVSAEIAASAYDVTPTAARAALNRLQEAGVLVPTRVGRRRDREWISDELSALRDSAAPAVASVTATDASWRTSSALAGGCPLRVQAYMRSMTLP